METAFTSLGGRYANRDLILKALQIVSSKILNANKAELQIMCFAFTDDVICKSLYELARQHENLQVKILADWSQLSKQSASVVPFLATAGRPNLKVNLKLDFPYRKNPKSGSIEWNYLASHGMLHHKTMCLVMDDEPEILTFGSFNWSNRGGQAYENTVLLQKDNRTKGLIEAFESEFSAIWNDPQLSVSYAGALKLAKKAREIVRKDGNLKDPETLATLLGFEAKKNTEKQPGILSEGPIHKAFSGKGLFQERPQRGFGFPNNVEKINLLRPNGKRKPAPLTLNTLALEAIRLVPDGDEICVAMYAMSPRVPEFNALLQAARRGCRIKVLLDQKIGAGFANELARKSREEQLPIVVKATNRRMHQKYILAPSARVVATGTANMTLDATLRHFDHRILFNGIEKITERFAEDFREIWDRIL